LKPHIAFQILLVAASAGWLSRFTGCAAHPAISPIPLKAGQTYSGITLSAETIVPVFVYRKGISDDSDFGVRIGLPFYGSGLDYSRVVFRHKRFFDILNVGFSLTPNSCFDMTYYTVRLLPVKPKNSYYTAFRIMYIPSGITDQRSVRVGFLGGLNFASLWGLEVGYFHDFDKGQPIEYLLSPQPHNESRYPAVTDFGFPSEHSRLVGLTCQLNLSTRIFSNLKDKPHKTTQKKTK